MKIRSFLLLTVLFVLISLSDAHAQISGFLPSTPLGATICVSVDSSGNQANNYSSFSDLSDNGVYAVYDSAATNLVAGDTNGKTDIFVYDRLTGTTTRVSVDSAGLQANNNSGEPVISGDGRYVAFHSYASNLVDDDTNGTADVFIHDRQTGGTTRVSIDSSGLQGNGTSYEPAISSNGRFVTFWSTSNNLVPDDTNNKGDVFIHDLQTGITTRVSVDSNGNQALGGGSGSSSVSDDGRYVAFNSEAYNLVDDDMNNVPDIFVRDLLTGTTTRVSVDSSGVEGNMVSAHPFISGDGRYAAFHSDADNLVNGDTNGFTDVFVHDRQTGSTVRVSVDSGGGQANNHSLHPALSSNGQFVVFASYASNLVTGDANGEWDIFVHDLQAGSTTQVSVNSIGVGGNGRSEIPAISGNGTFVSFVSESTNLIPVDANGESDIFMHGPLPGTLPISIFLPAAFR